MRLNLVYWLAEQKRMIKVEHRIDWDQYFMMQAALLASRSTCQRLSVGAVLVRDKRIIAGGYNGSVSCDDHCLTRAAIYVTVIACGRFMLK